MANKQEFIRAISRFLVPMLNAEISHEVESTDREQIVASVQKATLLGLKPHKSSDYRIVLKRSQRFTSEEKRLCENFVRDFANLSLVDNRIYYDEIFSGMGTRLVSNFLDKNVVRLVLNTLTKWSSQTYEGKSITACFGIEPKRHSNNAPRLIDIVDDDYLKVLSNGYDTLLSINGHGRILDLCKVRYDEANNLVAPYRLNGIAKWSEGERIAIALNQHGQIFVFSQGELLFALRAGEWLYFAHENIKTRMSPSKHIILKSEIYKSCLDTSFARVGGCIAVMRRGTSLDKLRDFVSGDDIIQNDAGNKTKLLHSIIRGDKFQNINRSIRLEILSMDGATVLDHDGNIMTAGAIVKVPAGSTGGGRRAAAIALSQLGMGIKISADGGILGFSSKRIIFET